MTELLIRVKLPDGRMTTFHPPPVFDYKIDCVLSVEGHDKSDANLHSVNVSVRSRGVILWSAYTRMCAGMQMPELVWAE